MDGWMDEKNKGVNLRGEKKNVALDWFILELSHIVNYVVMACQRLKPPPHCLVCFYAFEDRNCSVQERS